MFLFPMVLVRKKCICGALLYKKSQESSGTRIGDGKPQKVCVSNRLKKRTKRKKAVDPYGLTAFLIF